MVVKIYRVEGALNSLGEAKSQKGFKKGLKNLGVRLVNARESCVESGSSLATPGWVDDALKCHVISSLLPRDLFGSFAIVNCEFRLKFCQQGLDKVSN